MITDKLKAKAIAKIKANKDLNVISEEFDIPVPVLKDWQEELDPADMVVLEANINAIDIVKNSEHIEPHILQSALENAAMDITKSMPLVALNGDMVHANALKLCAEAVTKLYTTIILKNNAVIEVNSNTENASLEAFHKLLSD